MRGITISFIFILKDLSKISLDNYEPGNTTGRSQTRDLLTTILHPVIPIKVTLEQKRRWLLNEHPVETLPLQTTLGTELLP